MTSSATIARTSRRDGTGAGRANVMLALATIGFAALQFFAPEFSDPADFGLRRDKWWTACLALFAVYGVLRVSYLVP